jgi:hypothetical protein
MDEFGDRLKINIQLQLPLNAHKSGPEEKEGYCDNCVIANGLIQRTIWAFSQASFPEFA